MCSEECGAPKVGALVRDVRSKRIGEFMAAQGGRYLLRPQGGGCEWEVSPGEAETLTPEEALRAKVAEANRRSERGLFPPDPPKAVDGCAECLEYVQQRRAARRVWDWSAASDANVLLRRHQAEAHA